MIEIVLGGDGSSSPLWIDVCEPTAEDLSQVADQFGLPRAVLDESMAPLHLPKHERLGATTIVIARVYDEESPSDADGFRELTRKLAIFIGDRFLVTIHRRRLPFLEALKQQVRDGGEASYLQVVMLEILLAGVETLHEPLEQGELRIHDFEATLLDQKGSGSWAVAWKDVFRTKVRIQTFKRLLWHTQNATQKFVPRSAVNQPLADDLRERIASLLFFAESLDEDLNNLLGVQLSLSSNRTNDIMRLLTLFSAVFLPITFIVGVYGMNFRFMPELESPYGYYGVWALIVVTVVVIVAWFRRRGWTGLNHTARCARRRPEPSARANPSPSEPFGGRFVNDESAGAFHVRV